MAPFSYSVLFLILNLLLSSTLLQASTVMGLKKGVIVGGWQPILDPTAKNVVEIAQFAVEEHNKKANSQLKFGGVIKGEQQVVSGMNYRLYISAKDMGKLKNYVAVVYDKPWEKLRSLTSFKKVA